MIENTLGNYSDKRFKKNAYNIAAYQGGDNS